jgi:hypothetical protein
MSPESIAMPLPRAFAEVLDSVSKAQASIQTVDHRERLLKAKQTEVFVTALSASVAFALVYAIGTALKAYVRRVR